MSLLNPGSVLLLETIGRSSGRLRFAPVGYLAAPEGAYVVGGGAAGMTEDPDWVRNLRAGRGAAAWVGRGRIRVRTEELHVDVRDGAQRDAARVWRAVPKYEAKSGRRIPYFRLTPTGHDGELGVHGASSRWRRACRRSS